MSTYKDIEAESNFLREEFINYKQRETMNISKGVVRSIGSKEVKTRFGMKPTYSLKVDDVWYSAGFKKPDVQENDYINFSWEANGNYKNIDVDSIKIVQQESQPSRGASVASVAGGVTMSKDDYWSRKEERDLETQQRIQLQSARNSALQTVNILVATNAIKLPAAQAKKYDAVLGLIDEITAKYYNDTVELYVAEEGQIGSVVEEGEIDDVV